MMRALLPILAAFVLVAIATGCTDKPGAEKALAAAGYSNIKVGGYGFGCDSRDPIATEFVATGPTGHRVRGVVCSGVVKGYTIRIMEFLP